MVSKDAKPSVQQLCPPGLSSGPIATDAEFIYYVASSQGGDRLMRISDRSRHEEIARADGEVRDLAASSSGLAWLTDSTLCWLPREGGPVQLVADNLDRAQRLVLGRQEIFWLDRTGLGVAGPSRRARRIWPEANLAAPVWLDYEDGLLWTLHGNSVGQRLLSYDPAKGAALSNRFISPHRGFALEGLLVHHGGVHVRSQRGISVLAADSSERLAFDWTAPWLGLDGALQAQEPLRRGVEGENECEGLDSLWVLDALHTDGALFVLAKRSIFWTRVGSLGHGNEPVALVVLRVPCCGSQEPDALARAIFSSPIGSEQQVDRRYTTRLLSRQNDRLVATSPLDGAIYGIAI